MRDAPAPLPAPAPTSASARGALALAIAITLPAIVLRFTAFHPDDAPGIGLLVFGAGIVAAAFLLTWAAEVAQLDIGSGLAIVFLALVTVLPEYAVDIYLAWTAATVEENRHLALANMTGANQLLIGLGWPTVALIVWWKRRQRSVDLGPERSGDVFWLFVATLYSVSIPLKGTIAWYDAAVLFAIYAVYVAGSKNEPEEHGELVGPPRAMAKWGKRRRRGATLGLFVWSAAAILVAAEPFVESLKAVGHKVGINEVLLIKWLAPLASEAPEFVVVVLLTLRGAATMGLGAFVSSKVNQWTLLVGGVPVAYGLAHLADGRPFAPSMAIDEHQVEELMLTAAQGLYAVATILDLNFSLRQALAILGLFLTQFVGSIFIELVLRQPGALGPFHNVFSAIYVVLAVERLWTQRSHIPTRVRQAFRRGRLTTEVPSGHARPVDVEPHQRPSDFPRESDDSGR